jgi:hypothetical protein
VRLSLSVASVLGERKVWRVGETSLQS